MYPTNFPFEIRKIAKIEKFKFLRRSLGEFSRTALGNAALR